MECPDVGFAWPLADVVTVAQPRANLDVDARRADRLVAPLEVEHHAIGAGVEHVLDRVAPLDLRLARLVRGAIARRLRLRAVAPFPFDGGAVELLEIVRAANQSAGHP